MSNSNECVIHQAHLKYAGLLEMLSKVENPRNPTVIREAVAQYVPADERDKVVALIMQELEKKVGGGGSKYRNTHPSLTLSSCQVFSVIAGVLSGLIAAGVLFMPVRGGYRKNKKIRSTKKKQNRKQRKQSRRQ